MSQIWRFKRERVSLSFELPMIISTEKGLYCPKGDFYIDPSKAVDWAIVTHAHSDHARRGSRQ